MNPALLRAYQYLVALVAVHMVVLGVANVLRVLAELALGASSGGFTGLPFLFAEGRNQPLDLHREQISLAIALLVVGGIAWWLHWRAADRAGDRASAWRAFYLHTVLFVTALLVAGYGARTIGLLLRGWLIDPLPALGPVPPLGFGDPDEMWLPRAAGALGMVVAAAGAWWWHSRVAERDRPFVDPGGRAAQLRRLATYALVFIAAVATLMALSELVAGTWRAFLVRPEPVMAPEGVPDIVVPPQPDTDRQIRFVVMSSLPTVLAFGALLAAQWRRGRRLARLDTAEGEAERSSTIRQAALALTLLTIGGAGLANAAGAFSATLEFLGGSPAFPIADPFVRPGFDALQQLQFRLADNVPSAAVLLAAWIFGWVLWQRERAASAWSVAARRLFLYVVLGTAVAVSLINAGRVLRRAVARVLDGPGIETGYVLSLIPYAVLFGVAWWYHRPFAARAPGAEWARRAYQHLFLLVSLGAWAIGLAGTVGVAGSYVLGQQTHQPLEIGLYVALLAVGFPAWLFQWEAVAQTLTPQDRASRIRRVALSLAVLGGVIALLAFGAGALFRLLNMVLGLDFSARALHDLWHLVADSAVGALVAWWHWRVLRAERGAEPETAPAVVSAPAFVVVIPAADALTRERVLAAAGPEASAVETDAADVEEVRRRLARPR